MQSRKKFVSVVAIILALLMVFSIVVSVLSSLSASAASLTEIEKDLAETKSALEALEANQDYLAEKKAELQNTIDNMESDVDTYETQKATLDEKIDVAQQEIENVNEQLVQCEEMLAEKEAQLQLAIEEEEYQFERYTDRLRAMEEDGNMTYLSILLSSSNFSNLLSKINDITEIIEYDNMIADELEAARVAVEETKLELEETKAELDVKVAGLEDTKAAIEAEVVGIQDEIDRLVVAIEETTAEYEDTEAAMEEAEQEMLALVAKQGDLTAEQKAEIAKAEAAKSSGGSSSGGGSVVATGIFIWPSVSNKVTSSYGGRIHPITGIATNHAGIDIGASYGSSVYAAASGVVVQAGWNGGYGNYILVNHGNGYMTAYAHMSQLKVSSGDTVVQGQVIGLVGSTGTSTGNHLHFEVYVGSSRTDPLNYFSSGSYVWA